MAHLLNSDLGYEARQPPKAGRWVYVAVVCGLAIFGASAAIVWRTYGNDLFSFSSATSAAPTAGPAVAVQKAVTPADFQAFQQQIAASLQSNAQLLAAQQAEIKRLTDQLSVLTAKVDLLQRPAPAAPAALPVPPPAKQLVRKKPVAAKPATGISVGGAPLPSAAQSDR